ncbi:hypothetical protein N5C81_26795 [Rhizobium pusense]|uniref:hypothetical protein n=1 Tax=Agrobacterium pusense TaxID=648995 RepID=UPI00244807D8|nr:hypothetical protein [Agrobacterium pusense]MDH1271215.1 hypothetical protein [Agrobacterium pusense]
MKLISKLSKPDAKNNHITVSYRKASILASIALVAGLFPLKYVRAATIQGYNGVSTTGYVEAVSATGPWLATQAEAESGTNNDQIMTPLRVKQALAAQSTATDRISTTNVSSGATLGMVVADRGTVSFTLAGTQGAAYLHATAGLVGPAISTTTGNVQTLRILNSIAGEAAATPGFSWSGDTNTGMYWVGADQLGFSAGGTQRALINTTGMTVTGIVTATSFEGDGSKLANLPQGTTTLTGNVTGSGAGTIATTIADNAVTTAKITANAVTAVKLASNAVSSTHIIDGSILSADLSDSAVTLAKIQNISTNMLLGRATAGTGNVEQITIGSGLALSGTILTAPTTADNLGNHTATTTIKATNGTVALPAYTWSGDTDTGLYWVAADQLGVATGGVQRALVNASGLRVVGYISSTGVIDAGAAIYGFSGDSVTAPGYTWSGDTNTGMYWVGADQLGLTAGGVQRLLVNTTGATVTGNFTATGSLTGNTVAGGMVATQAEAEAGTDDTHIMTPLRVLQAITKALSTTSTVPAGAIMAFDLTSCPTGWTEYTPARGRFLRGIDNGAGNDPQGTRAPGNVQSDANRSHSHAGVANSAGAHTHQYDTGQQAQTSGPNQIVNDNVYASGDQDFWRLNTTSSGAHTHTLTINADGDVEARPKNVAVLYCRKS